MIGAAALDTLRTGTAGTRLVLPRDAASGVGAGTQRRKAISC